MKRLLKFAWGSGNGLKLTRGESFRHFCYTITLSDTNFEDYTINSHLTVYQLVLSQYMHFFILQTELRPAVLFGPIGPSLWSAFAGSCNRGSRVDDFPLQTLIIMLSPWLRFRISRFAIICMKNCHGNQETWVHKKGFVRQIVSKLLISLSTTTRMLKVLVFKDPTCMLLHPHVANPVIDNGLFTKIIVCLATRYNKTVGAVRQHLSVNDIEQWGKVQIVGGGDTMVASSLVKYSQEDSRNATYVRVSI